jgi:ribose/xylose/arabinose/galactoside ABC-type transport system permease subunit
MSSMRLPRSSSAAQVFSARAGSVTGTLIGALIMSVLRNGLNLLSVSSYLQQVAIGTVIVAAVLIDMALRRRANLPKGTTK